MEIVALCLATLLGIWVYRDAKARHAGRPGLWAIGAFLMAVIVLPIWLMKRPPKGAAMERHCPYCAEEIERTAVICRFCRRDISPIKTAAWSLPRVIGS